MVEAGSVAEKFGIAQASTIQDPIDAQGASPKGGSIQTLFARSAFSRSGDWIGTTPMTSLCPDFRCQYCSRS